MTRCGYNKHISLFSRVIYIEKYIACFVERYLIVFVNFDLSVKLDKFCTYLEKLYISLKEFDLRMNNKSLRNHFSKNFYLRQEGIFELTRLDETNTPRYNIEEINISLTKINLIPSPSPPPRAAAAAKIKQQIISYKLFIPPFGIRNGKSSETIQS